MKLIDDVTFADLVELDDSAMPSLCTIHHRTTTSTGTGGSTPSAWADRNAVPMPCRVSLGGLATQERVAGERVTSLADLTVQISLAALKKQNVVIDSDDEITVSTEIPYQFGKELPVTERYKVIGDPSYGSYSTNLAVPVLRVS